MSKQSVLLILILLAFKIANAQFYSTGQDPASAKWHQINTHNFQIIFQEDFEEKAQFVAKTLEFYYQQVAYSLNHNPKKISVVLHNQTITSNGYVAWAPKRMELYATPSPDNYPDLWLEHLCIHESRHVVQLDKLNQGVTKLLTVVFGQQFTGLVAGQLPLWYYEGDAVSTETAFSKFGRGRLPEFQKGLRTHLLSDDNTYSFDKMLFGSYKDYVPNHYQVGYQLTAFARKKYGADVWSTVQDHVAKNSYTLLPTTWAFYRGLKKNYGISQKQLYDQTINYLDSTWKQENTAETKPVYFQDYLINDYENYINPIVISEDKIIALKKGFSHIPCFVSIEKNKEEKVFEPGYVISDDFSFSNNLLVWAEYKADIRWTNREFTSIKLLNIKTGKHHTLVKRSRYFSPELSPKADKIAVVEVDKKNNSTLLILDILSGDIIKRIESRNNNFISRPQWGRDEKSIFVIETTPEGKQVAEYNLEIQQWNTVFKSDNDIQRIIPSGNKIYFHSTHNGTDNIYVFDGSDQNIYQLSDSEFGITDFDIDTTTNQIIASDYTSQGSRIIIIPEERALWSKIDNNNRYKFELAETITSQEPIIEQNKLNQTEDYEVKKYYKALNLFNFHSWIPFYYDYQGVSVNNVLQNPGSITEDIYPGIMLMSQNKLSTTETVLSYSYKNGQHYISSSLELKGNYPVIRLSADYGEDQQIQLISDNVWVPPASTGYSYNIDMYLPLDFSRGKYVMGLRPWISFEYSNKLYYNYQENYYLVGLEYLQTDLLLYMYQRTAERDIIPQRGSLINISLFNTPFDQEIFGNVFNLDGTFYIPGGRNKAIKLNLGYQHQKTRLYRFGTRVRFPRGISDKPADIMYISYNDYVFPIAYPDWNLGSLIYLKRIRGSVFFDFAYSTYKTSNNDLSAMIWPKTYSYSVGGELSFDYHLLRTIFPLNTGLRFGYALSESKAFAELIFGIDIFNF